MVDVARPFSTLNHLVESTRLVRKADFAEILHSGAEAVLERKRMISMPLPARHASSSLNRVQIEDALSMNMELTNADEEDDEEGSDAASTYAASTGTSSFSLHKSFTADTKSYEALQRGGRRASQLLGLHEVQGGASSAFISALRSKSRLLVDIEESSIMKQVPVRVPSLQAEQPALAWSQSSMLATAVTPSAADLMLQQLQTAGTDSTSKPKSSRRCSISVVPDTSLYSPSRAASMTLGSASGHSTPLLFSPRAPPAGSASKLPLIGGPPPSLAVIAAASASASGPATSRNPAHSVPLAPIPPLQPRTGSAATMRRASLTSQPQARDNRLNGLLFATPADPDVAPASMGTAGAAAGATGSDGQPTGTENPRKLASQLRNRPASRMNVMDTQSILRSPSTLPPAFPASTNGATSSRHAWAAASPTPGAGGSAGAAAGSPGDAGGDADLDSKDRTSGFMGRFKQWVKKHAD